MNNLQDKRIIVTGAASGIGRAAAELFARSGAWVLAVDVNDSVAELAAAERIETGVVDVADETAVAACVREAGKLDVMFANAGVAGRVATIDELSAADWRRVLDVNLIGAFNCIKYAAAAMSETGGGSIICTASVAGLRSGAGPAPYSASKAGIINLVMVAAQQLTGSGVRVNAICPGLIETGMTKPVFDRAREKGVEGKIGQLNPTRRAGQPEEVARVAAFLAGDESSYINGQALVVDGGLSTSHPFIPGKMW